MCYQGFLRTGRVSRKIKLTLYITIIQFIINKTYLYMSFGESLGTCNLMQFTPF